MNYDLSARMLARLFAVIAVAQLASIPWGWDAPHHGGAGALAIGALVALALAAALLWLGKGPGSTLRVRDALFVVSVGWFAAGLLGALPYMISGAIPGFADAFFETVSGLTTTGSTILTDIESLPKGLHFWRVATHWLGGLGIVVIFVALFPQLGVGAKHLFKSEVPGPVTEGLRPKIKQTAMALWWIYLGLTALESLLLWLAGMSLFEAVAHAMSTMATGGFSTRNTSIAAFESPMIEWIICLFMYLAGVNFGLHYAALTGRRLSQFVRNAEWRVYTAMVVFASLFVAAFILPLHGGDPHEAARAATFQVLALVTTTGFGTDDFTLWPVMLQVLIIALMITGGSAGSTAGGMKVSRVIIMVKGAAVELLHTARPHAVQAVKLGRQAVRMDVMKGVYAYGIIFAATVFVSSMWLSSHGVDLITSLTASLTCVANVGPGLGGVGPSESFAFLSADSKVVLASAMILGRLEFFTVLALVLPSTWKRG